MNLIKKFLYLSLILLSTSTQAASVCSRQDGEMHCGAGTVESIDYTGDVILDGTTITGRLKTLGDLTAKNANINHINIIGDADISGSQIIGSTIVVGDIHSKKTKFNDTVKITGDSQFSDCEFQANSTFIGDMATAQTYFRADVTLSTLRSQFTHSMLKDIVVKKQDPNVKQVIDLRDRSLASNIKFSSNKGIVELSDGSSIQGSVTGGKTINH